MAQKPPPPSPPSTPVRRHAPSPAPADAAPKDSPAAPADTLLELAEATDPDLVVGGPLPAPDPATLDPDAPLADWRLVNLLALLFEVSPTWDDVLRHRVLSKPDDYNALLDRVKDAALVTCWPDWFYLKKTGPDSDPTFTVQPLDADSRPTRLDVLEDAATTSALVNGRRALLLFVDTVPGGQAVATQGDLGHPRQVQTFAAQKGQALVLCEGWTSLDLPQLGPRLNRTAILIRSLA